MGAGEGVLEVICASTGVAETGSWEVSGVLGVGVPPDGVAGVVGVVGFGVGVVGGWVGCAFLVLVKAAVTGVPGLAVIFTGVESSW
ncbi:hypothetical protein GCM10010336_61170 [Streptomyces goshikiensis]|nr:hypothetical protein GCM10010336_61170 [Streptomyces goshikiensis]